MTSPLTKFPPLAVVRGSSPSMCSHLGATGSGPNIYHIKNSTRKGWNFLCGLYWTRTSDPIDVNDVLCQQRQYIQLFTAAEPFDYWAFWRSRGSLPAVYLSVWLGCAHKQPNLSAGSLAGNRLASLVVVCWLYCRKQKKLPDSSNLSRPGDVLSQALTATGARNCSAVMRKKMST